VRKIIDAVESAIQKTGPELSGDLVENGIVLCGGGALLPDLDLVLEEETGLPVRVADDPLRMDGFKRACEGVTTVEEILRVTQEDA
jgi:rod shape-determining protein MreB